MLLEEFPHLVVCQDVLSGFAKYLEPWLLFIGINGDEARFIGFPVEACEGDRDISVGACSMENQDDGSGLPESYWGGTCTRQVRSRSSTVSLRV